LAPNPILLVPLEEKGNLETDTHTAMPCEDEGHDCGDASTGQETPKMATNHGKPRKRQGKVSSSKLSEGTSPADTILAF
jgi:hypothetical protein